MGMDAELLAIGKFSAEIAGHLDYPRNFYIDTPEDSTIITGVCDCVTTDGSELLAEALGIDPWQFQEHCNISGENADLEKMGEAIENPAKVNDFVALREAGFKFYYLPNG